MGEVHVPGGRGSQYVNPVSPQSSTKCQKNAQVSFVSGKVAQFIFVRLVIFQRTIYQVRQYVGSPVASELLSWRAPVSSLVGLSAGGAPSFIIHLGSTAPVSSTETRPSTLHKPSASQSQVILAISHPCTHPTRARFDLFWAATTSARPIQPPSDPTRGHRRFQMDRAIGRF